jgi:hypothetical protein
MRRWAAALLVVAAGLRGQTTGALEGTLRDPSGAVVPGAKLRVFDTGTSAARSATTDGAGRYLALRLAPGNYEITASHPGFRDQARTQIGVEAGATVRLDFVLELGEARDRVVVAADAVLVDASPTGSGGAVKQQQMESLPLAGRDVFELAAEQPAVLRLRIADQSVVHGEGAKFSVHGVRPTQNGFVLDGIRINDSTSSVAASAALVTLGLEGMREVRIVTSPFSAEYGRSAGAVFTAVTKSGSNEFHGSAYEFFRHSALDARNFFDDPTAPSPPFRRNQFGGLLGGPIRRNRVFFLVNYEGIRETLTNTFRPTVPTADVRQGRLPVAGGGVRVVTVSPAIRPYLNLYPLPNGRDFGDGTAEYVHESVRSTREDYVAGKMDVLASPALRLSGRYTFDDSVRSQPEPLAIWSFSSASRNQFAHIEAQHLVSARTIHTFRTAFTRVPNAELGNLLIDVPASLSFVPGQPLGVITVTGLAEIGGSGARQRPRRHNLNDYQVNDELVQIRGGHTLKAGVGFDRIQFNQVSDFSAIGYYQFSSLSDFLTAVARTGDVMVPGSDSHRGWRQSLGFGYFQDEVRLRGGLSFSFGLRYEFASTPTEVNGKVASLRNFASDPQMTLGGPVYRNPSKRNFAPRASVAWDPTGTGRMVVRAGAGIFFDLPGIRDLIIAGGRVPPFFNRATLTRPPFPDILAAVGSAPLLNALDTIDYYLVQPYVAQYQLSVERQLTPSTVLRAGYAGTRGIHLMSFVGNVNATRPQVLSDGRIFLPPGGPRLNPAFSQIAMRRAQFDSAYHGLTISLDRRWRNGLSFQASYMWSKSIDDSSATISNDFVPSDFVPTVYNYRGNRGLSDFDLRHVFALSLSWRLPSGGARGPAGILRGWEMHTVTKAQGGHPFAPTVGFDRVGLQSTRADLGQRPNFIGQPGGKVILGDPQLYFDPTAFGLPDAGYFGNLGRGTLAGPGLFALDAALHKVLWQTERHSVRFRFEAFNVTNHPNFRQPSGLALFDSTGARVGSAGRITDTTTTSRQVQMAVKWVF